MEIEFFEGAKEVKLVFFLNQNIFSRKNTNP